MNDKRAGREWPRTTGRDREREQAADRERVLELALDHGVDKDFRVVCRAIWDLHGDLCAISDRLDVIEKLVNPCDLEGDRALRDLRARLKSLEALETMQANRYGSGGPI